MDLFFEPRSIAVVGASNALGKWGFGLIINIINGRYKGRIYPVNPKEKNVLGLPCWPSILEINGDIDVALVTVPALNVPDVINECGQKGVKYVLIISSNFSEVGDDGRQLEDKVVSIAHKNGIRLIGPNTMGYACPYSNLMAMGSGVKPPSGDIAFVSQSGNLGVQVLGWAEEEGIGISRFVNTGNESDLMCDEFLEYLGKDERTRVILMYLEGIDRGRRFMEVARQVIKEKPIIVLKSGKTNAGSKAALSHSGAIAGDCEISRDLFRQTGIVEADSTEDLLDLAKAFSRLPIPGGSRVAVVTMGGGWGVVAADACDRAGLELSPLSEGLKTSLDELLPSFWSRGNPVDIVGSLRRSNHIEILKTLMEDDGFDSVICMGMITGARLGLFVQLKEWIRFSWVYLTSHGINLLKYYWVILLSIYRSIKEGRKKGHVKQDSEDKRIKRARSGGINLREIREWKDESLARRIMNLMQDNEKPLIAVSFRTDTLKPLYSRFRLVGYGVPERAAHVLAKLAQYGNYMKRSEKKEIIPPNPPFPKGGEGGLEGGC